MDLSSEPVSKHSPFGLKATVLTVLLCALMMLLLPSLQIKSNIFVWDSENYFDKKGFVFLSFIAILKLMYWYKVHCKNLDIWFCSRMQGHWDQWHSNTTPFEHWDKKDKTHLR